MNHEEIAKEKVRIALGKIERLKEFRKELSSGKYNGRKIDLPRERIRQLESILEGIERRTSGLIVLATRTANELTQMEIRPDSSEKEESSVIGGLLGKLTGLAGNTAKSIIADVAAPVTKSVLKTSANLTKATLNCA